jgi:Tol biopolymer transport system component
LAAVVCAAAFVPASVYAAGGTKSMKAYDTVKSGNYVYCAAANGIYKVNIKTKKVTRLAKGQSNEYLHALKKKGKYIYYMCNGVIYTDVMRVKTTGGKVKKVFNGYNSKAVCAYAISKNKLYVTYGTGKTKVMSLSGKSGKTTTAEAKTIEKRTNNSNYKVTTVGKGDYFYTYLKMPGKKLFIEKAPRM